MTKPNRKAVVGEAYEMAVKNNWTVNEAAAWATKKHGSRINKAEVQYFALKAGKPYLDELIHGIRTVTR
jgi:hypothetical protein